MNFDQIDVIPVYQSLLVTMQVLAGLLMMNEIQFYSMTKLIFVFVGAACCITGINVLIMKKKVSEDFVK